MKTVKIVAFWILYLSVLFGQDYNDVLRPFLGQDIQSAGIGVSETDLSTSNYNPASLSMIRHPSLKLNFSNNLPSSSTRYLTNEVSFADTLSDYRLLTPSFEAILPIPVYRGAWVIGFSLSPQRYFNEMTELNYVENDTVVNKMNKYDSGNLNTAVLSSAVLFTQKLSLGASISLLWGDNNFSSIYHSETNDSYYRDTLSIKPSYLGWNTKLAWMWKTNPYITFGGWLELPTRLDVKEQFYYKDETPTVTYSETDKINYTLSGPYHIGHTMQINGDPIDFSVGLIYHNYSGMSMESNLLNNSGLSLDADINQKIPKKLNGVFEWQFGARINREEFNIFLTFSTMQHPRESITTNIQKYNAGLNIPLTKRLKFETSLQTQTQSDRLLIISAFPNDAYAEINYNFVNILMGVRYQL